MSGERPADGQVNLLLTKWVKLFSFVIDRDLFVEFHRNQLPKRLLYETLASENAVKTMIAKFMLDCGTQFTSTLEGAIEEQGARAQSWLDSKLSHLARLLAFELGLAEVPAPISFQSWLCCATAGAWPRRCRPLVGTLGSRTPGVPAGPRQLRTCAVERAARLRPERR